MRTRIDKLGRTLKSIKQRKPRIIARHCGGCDCYVKNETMWKYVSYRFGTDAVWTCTRCAPTKLDVINQNPKDFSGVDTRPLTDDDARAEREFYLTPKQ